MLPEWVHGALVPLDGVFVFVFVFVFDIDFAAASLTLGALTA